MALTTISTVTATIQKFYEDSWMDLPQRFFMTPLANSGVLEVATIPKHAGQYAEFRTFDHLDVETNGTDDSPMTYGENAEPSAPLVLSATNKQVAFEMVSDYMEIGNVADATDPTGLIKKGKDEMFTMIPRKIHQLTNDRCVKPIVATVLNASVSPTPLPAPFKTIYGSSVNNFGALTPESVHTMADYKKARSLLRNLQVPGAFGELYAAFINEAIKDQLMEDSGFADYVKRHEDLGKKALVMGHLMDYKGMRWIMQDDAYRCALPAAAGALTTRLNTGNVHVAHVMGKGAMGYVDFGGNAASKDGGVMRRTLRPKFKIQDISKTGTGPSVGYRMPYQACVLNRSRGVNIAGTTQFGQSIDDI